MAKPVQSTIKSKINQQDAGPGTPVKFIFDKGNYRWFLISIAVVVIGFYLMAGNTDIYSNTKIVVAPIIVLAGFGIGFYAILKKPESN